MQIGIVGLPFSGKTTLFQTLTQTYLDSAAAHKQDAHVAMVKVPDERVDKLGEMFNPKKLVYTSIEFVDVVGLKRDDRNSAQFTNTFLAKVKTNDALLHVVKTFDDPMYPHSEGSIDPVRDVAILEAEFILADMAMAESRIDKLKKQIQKTQDDRDKAELAALEKCYKALEEERPLRTLDISPQEEFLIRGFQMLSQKPLMVVLNLSEAQLGERERMIEEIRTKYAASGIHVDAFAGKIEMEMAQLEDEESEMFMQEYGIQESALNRIIGSAYKTLGLISFLTFGEDECRAWTIEAGTNAQNAAGEIHTDLMNRFIRAEVVHFDDLMKHGSIQACKDEGVWRLEGKEYTVKDGDLMTIRHG
ncbi:MAG: redox-regulated ATPase YchF [Ectothiorhodospiraceae bacterium]|nr:redox-regulated ATPase YchF [Ectothiorhodospiraceae bacterium]